MRKAKIEQDRDTQKIFCPECDKTNFTIFRKEPLNEDKIYLHHARREDCGEIFVFKVNPQGKIFVD